MTRVVYRSSKAAIGRALADRAHAAGLASTRDAAPGPPPDPWLASNVLACIRRAGLDPHDESDPVVAGIYAWATHADRDQTDRQLDGKITAAMRRIGLELVEAGIVDTTREQLPATGRRAVVRGGELRFVASTHATGSGAKLRADVEAGRVAPVVEEPCPVPEGWISPEERARQDIARARAEDISEAQRLYQGSWPHDETVDQWLAARWGCSVRTARRARAKIFELRRGRRKAA